MSPRIHWNRSARAGFPLASIAAALALLVFGASPALGFLPYRMMLEAARSPEKPLAFVHDRVLRLDLRKALIAADPDDALSVSPHVYGGHAYLVGWVASDAERERIEAAARSVPGIQSLTSYLPIEPSGAAAPNEADELALKTKIEEAITLDSDAHRANVSVDVLGTHAVLVGVVASGAAVQTAGEAARRTPGVSGVTSFLSVPEPGNEKLLEGLLP